MFICLCLLQPAPCLLQISTKISKSERGRSELFKTSKIIKIHQELAKIQWNEYRKKNGKNNNYSVLKIGKKLHLFPPKKSWKSMKIIGFGVPFSKISIISISRTTEPILKFFGALNCYDFSLQVKNTSSTFPRLSNFAF